MPALSNDDHLFVLFSPILFFWGSAGEISPSISAMSLFSASFNFAICSFFIVPTKFFCLEYSEFYAFSRMVWPESFEFWEETAQPYWLSLEFGAPKISLFVFKLKVIFWSFFYFPKIMSLKLCSGCIWDGLRTLLPFTTTFFKLEWRDSCFYWIFSSFFLSHSWLAEESVILITTPSQD